MLKRLEGKLSTIGILYFVFGFFFAIFYALFYHWEAFGFLSPGFYMVAITWPFQLPGLIFDFQIYGMAGKVL